jgi:hypothetical protein
MHLRSCVLVVEIAQSVGEGGAEAQIEAIEVRRRHLHEHAADDNTESGASGSAC